MYTFATFCAALTLAATTLGAGAASVDVGPPLKFAPGTPKLKARLQAIPALRELVEENFAVALVDLNDDGNNELVTISRRDAFCGSGGCMVVVVEVKGGRARVLLQQNLDESMAVTRETFGGYHALAAVDETGAVQIANKPGTPLHGKPMVYPMAGAPGPVAASRTAAPDAATAPTAPAPHPAPATGAWAPDMLGLRLGQTTAAQARPLLDALQPGSTIQVRQVQLTFNAPGVGDKPVPGGEYTAAFNLVPPGSARCGDRGTHCERIETLFAAPPGDRLLAVMRRASFEEITGARYEQSLVDKYGPPSVREESGTAFVKVNLTWAWRADGQPVSGLHRRPPCGSIFPMLDTSLQLRLVIPTLEKAADAGCDFRLYATYTMQNGMTRGATLFGDAPTAAVRTDDATSRMVQAAAEAFDRQRKAAGQGAAPVRN
jgi:hypothetical protein